MMLLLFCLVFATLLSGATQASTPYIYEGGFEVLTVGKLRFNETMEFPSGISTEIRRRYILAGLKPGRLYVVHLSFLGSPLIEYKIHAGRLHRSLIEMRQQQTKEEGGYHPTGRRFTSPRERKLADVNMLHFLTHGDELLLDFVGGDGAVDIGDVGPTEISVGGEMNDNDYIPVLEVRGRRSGFPYHPEKWRTFSYNLRIDAIGNFEGLDLTSMAHSVLVVICVIGSTFLSSRLVALIAGDAPQPRKGRDFLVFFWNLKTETK